MDQVLPLPLCGLWHRALRYGHVRSPKMPLSKWHYCPYKNTLVYEQECLLKAKKNPCRSQRTNLFIFKMVLRSFISLNLARSKVLQQSKLTRELNRVQDWEPTLIAPAPTTSHCPLPHLSGAPTSLLTPHLNPSPGQGPPNS